MHATSADQLAVKEASRTKPTQTHTHTDTHRHTQTHTHIHRHAHTTVETMVISKEGRVKKDN